VVCLTVNPFLLHSSSHDKHCWVFVRLHLLQCLVNLLIPTLKPQSNRPLYCSTIIGTLAIDGWAVTFGTVTRDMGGLGPPINGQSINFILFDVAL